MEGKRTETKCILNSAISGQKRALPALAGNAVTKHDDAVELLRWRWCNSGEESGVCYVKNK